MIARTDAAGRMLRTYLSGPACPPSDLTHCSAILHITESHLQIVPFGGFLAKRSMGPLSADGADAPVSLLGPGSGMPVERRRRLMVTLRFVASEATPANVFAFEPETFRQVTVCPTAGGLCDDISGDLTWTGGTLTVP